MSPDDFFVGYLPTPSGVRRLLTIVVALVAVSVCGLSIAIAALQRDPGEGTWQLDKPIEVTGVVRAFPYPLLETDASPLLIVSEGKVGAFERLKTFDGQEARL